MPAYTSEHSAEPELTNGPVTSPVVFLLASNSSVVLQDTTLILAHGTDGGTHSLAQEIKEFDARCDWGKPPSDRLPGGYSKSRVATGTNYHR